MFDLELESIKTAIGLRTYAAGQGCGFDHKDSSQGMRHANGDKIVMKRNVVLKRPMFRGRTSRPGCWSSADSAESGMRATW
jgi:hypothetical protein